MGNLALKDMSVEEKIATIETLWDDLCQQHLESPSWHADVLQQRDMIRQQGNEQPVRWEEAKQDILKHHGIHSKYLDKYYKMSLLSDGSRISSYPT